MGHEEEVETFGKELHIQTEMEKEQLKQKK